MAGLHKRTHSDVTTLSCNSVDDEPPQSYPGAYTSLPANVVEGDGSDNLVPTDSDQLPRNSSTQQEATSLKQNSPEAHATLERSAFHEWFSTLFDAILSLVPLFILGRQIRC